MRTETRDRLLGLSGYLALAGLLAAGAGAATWGRESVILLGPSLRASFEAATPLPAVYNLDIVLYAVLGAGALFAALKLAVLLARSAGVMVPLMFRRRRIGQRGQAMAEFAISFPIVLITTLILIQLALMYQARNVVTYAAFAAARAAIVWIPAETENEGVHEINTDGGQKWNKIHQAASLACVPISPRASVVLAGMPGVGGVLGDVFGAFSGMMSGLGLAGEYLDSGLQRYAYSTFATEVKLYKATEAGFEEQSGTVTWNYPTDADVAVRVRHRYYLPIPLVNRFIGDEWSFLSIPPFFSLNLPGQYTFIRSVSVLPLEGRTGDPPISGWWD
jgi:hypothetical protein